MPPKRSPKSKLPVPLPEGQVLKDLERKQWRLGKKIGEGGFGLIYLASPHVDRPVEDKVAVHVIKVEYLENGPLFSELKFYQRAAKPENIKKWIAQKRLKYLGIPRYWGTGAAEHNGKSYRFMVMDRLGSDLQNILAQRQLQKGRIMQLGFQVLEVLEYMHENEYVHGDIKAANLMQGFKKADEVYLADYGLSYRYCPDGIHKPYKDNPKKSHNGTIEFTSLDAHRGAAPSRRGDLEILGYCLLQWLCGKLPWEHSLKDAAGVQSAKTKLLDELPDSVIKLSSSESHTREIAEFLTCVSNLTYDEKPKYEVFKKILSGGLGSSGTIFKDLLDLQTLGCNSSKDLKVEISKPSPKPVKQRIPKKTCETGAKVTVNGSSENCLDAQEKTRNERLYNNETSRAKSAGVGAERHIDHPPIPGGSEHPGYRESSSGGQRIVSQPRQTPAFQEVAWNAHRQQDYLEAEEAGQRSPYWYSRPVTLEDEDTDENSQILQPTPSITAELYQYTAIIVVLLLAIFLACYCL